MDANHKLALTPLSSPLEMGAASSDVLTGKQAPAQAVQQESQLSAWEDEGGALAPSGIADPSLTSARIDHG